MVGIIKEVEKLGRIVIPKEYRDRYELKKNAEIIATEDGVLIRNPEYKLVRVHEAEAQSE
jgi:AbrB family looped-hinge helix DNA binding protein